MQFCIYLVWISSFQCRFSTWQRKRGQNRKTGFQWVGFQFTTKNSANSPALDMRVILQDITGWCMIVSETFWRIGMQRQSRRSTLCMEMMFVVRRDFSWVGSLVTSRYAHFSFLCNIWHRLLIWLIQQILHIWRIWHIFHIHHILPIVHIWHILHILQMSGMWCFHMQTSPSMSSLHCI